MGWGSVRVKYETSFWLRVRPDGVSWGSPVFVPPNDLALFETKEMILRESHGLKFYITRNKGAHTMNLVLYNNKLIQRVL